jgi:hypothetical protein
MLRFSIRLKGERRAAVLLGVLFLASLLHGSVAALQRPAAAVAPDAASALGSPGWHFYLTEANYHANQVLTACGAGYHMASLWEMLDVSNLTYDASHPAAYTKADSGFGPPSGWWGWVRTGQEGSSANVAGTGNCLAWTSTAGASYGSAVRLSSSWETAPGDISTWDAGAFSCNLLGPVWCVGSGLPTYLPAVMK